jgi:hypothetical protein
MGAIYPTLPMGCTSPNVQGETYYLCGNAWFSPSFGANGVYYRVVPTPLGVGAEAPLVDAADSNPQSVVETGTNAGLTGSRAPAF